MFPMSGAAKCFDLFRCPLVSGQFTEMFLRHSDARFALARVVLRADLRLVFAPMDDNVADYSEPAPSTEFAPHATVRRNRPLGISTDLSKRGQLHKRRAVNDAADHTQAPPQDAP